MTPALRRLSLIFVISWCWEGHPEELKAAALAKGIEPRETEDYPEWVTRDFEYIGQEMDEERKAYGLPSRTTEDASTPQDGAKALAAELNRRIED